MLDVFDLSATITLDTKPYEEAVDRVDKKTSSFGDGQKGGWAKVGKAAGVALAAATTAATAFAGESVKIGAAFDSAMSQVAATMGTTVDQIDNLREFAIEMGRTTAFSANQSAEALNYMALAGYDAETSMGMLPTVLDLAAAGGIDLARASDMVTDAQSALNLTLDETTAMVDQMAAASSKSNTSVEQLGDAMLTIGATARGLKGGTAELSTVLGVLADNGIKGAEGGTHLRNAILSLQTPTKDGKKALKELGMTYEDMYDSAGNLRSLPEIFQQMQVAMEGMTQQSKDAIVSGIFNKADLASVNALLGTSEERWNELSTAIEDSNGAAEKMAATQLDNLAGDVTLFKSALEGAQITISDALAPSLREFVGFGTDAIGKLATAFQEGGLDGAMEALGTILSDGLSMIIKNLPKFINAGLQLLSALGQGLLDNLPMIVETGLQIIYSLAMGIADSLPELIPTIVETILVIVDGLIENIDMLVEASIAIVMALAEGIASAAPMLIEKAPEIIAKLVGAIIENAPKMLEAGLAATEQMMEGMAEGFAAILTEIGTWVQENIITPLTDGVKAAVDVGRQVVENIKEGISNAWNSLVSWFNGIWDRLFGKRTINVTVNESEGRKSAIGLDYVPFNDFPATLHKGEAVLTAREADEWRRGTTSGGVINLTQNINAVAQTPVQLAAATAAYFEQARWTI